MGPHGFALLFRGVVMADPAYFREFWTEPGYLGSDPPPSLLKARIQHDTTVVEPLTAAGAEKAGLSKADLPPQLRGHVDTAWKALQDGASSDAPVGFRLASIPEGCDYTLTDVFVTSGAAEGTKLSLGGVAGDAALVGGVDPAGLAAIKPGDEVRIDNSDFLASQSYHRHQVPSADYSVWEQYRDSDDKPLYPQRPMLLGPLFTQAAAGTVQTGKFNGKMILVESLWDREAYPWQADWYRARAQEALGARHDDHFRLWFTDRALHGDTGEQEDPTRTVGYLGVLHQALRDLSRWVEDGVQPPASTAYEIVDGQVVVAASAAERNGIQPVVDLTVEGGPRVDIDLGASATFSAVVEAPPGTGTIVAAEWDFDGSGTFATKADLPTEAKGRVELGSTHRFEKAGTYFPTLRVASHREGDSGSAYARIANLARVRVVVE